MNRFQEFIEEIEHLLKQIHEKLAPFLSEENKKQKISQLSSVEKSIVQLQRTGMPIPDKLRELKLSLINEIEEFDEAHQANEILLEILASYSPKVPKRVTRGFDSSKTTNKISRSDLEDDPVIIFQENNAPEPVKESSIRSRPDYGDGSLLRFIQQGVINHNEIITRNFNGIEYSGKILGDGRILILSDEGETYFQNIHLAAQHIIKKPCNGFDFWRIKHKEFGHLVRLSTYLK